jgi:uncharacterized protein (DUF305 family)
MRAVGGLLLAGALAAAFAAAFAAGASRDGRHLHFSMASALCSTFEREMNAGMNRMMDDMHASGYSGDADADFLAMMVPHHAGAVDMARLVLQHGHDPATRQLAEEIIAGQTIEIESMRRRLAQLHAPRPEAGADYPALGGVRGPSPGG